MTSINLFSGKSQAFQRYQPTALSAAHASLGTSFLALRGGAPDEQRMEQMHARSILDQPIQEQPLVLENTFNKKGVYNLLYGPPDGGIANPVAAGVGDYNMDFGQGTKKEQAQAIRSPLFTKQELERAARPGMQRSPLFTQENAQGNSLQRALGDADPKNPYLTYGLRESAFWTKEKTVVLQTDAPPTCVRGVRVDGECINLY